MDGKVSGTATPRSKLDALPREDLIKLLKKMQLKVVKHQEVLDELSKLKLEREQTTLKSPVTSEERHMQTIEKIWNQQKTQTDQRELKLSEIQVQTYFPGIDSPTKSVAQISTKESSVQTEDLLRKLAAETQTEIVSTKTALELNERGMQTEGQNPNFRSSESQTDSAGKLQFKDLIVQTEIVLSNNADSQTDLPVQIGSKMAAKGCEMAIQTTTEQLPTFTVAKSQTDSTGENLDDLTKQLKTAQLDNEKLSGQLRELQSVCERVAVEKAELCSKLVSLETSMENSEIGHSKEIQLLKEELKSLAQKNEQPQFLSLEMEDYERGIRNMQQQIKSMEEEMARLNNLVDSKTKEIESNLKEMDGLRNQKTKSTETEKKLKVALIKAKKENEATMKTIEDKEKEIEELKTKSRELEMNADSLKIDLSSELSQRENLVKKLQEDVEEKDRRIRWVETEKTKMQLEIEAVQNELINTKHEFETYKVRVHNVLKNNRHSAEEDSWTYEKDHLTKTVELVQEKLKDVGAKYTTLQQDHCRLQEENDSLGQRLRDCQSCAILKEKTLKTQLENVTNDYMKETEKNSQIVRNLTQQNEHIRADFQDQIAKMNRDHSEMIKVYDERISHLESEISNYKRQLSSYPTSSDEVFTDNSEIHRPKNIENRIQQLDDSSFNPLLTERRPGEGSESFAAATPTRFAPIASPTSPFHMPSPLPLSDLLRSDTLSVTSSHTNDSAVKTPMDDHNSSLQLEKAMRRIDHLTEVLNETEGNNARLAEQARVLKEEIRRLERNQEREKHLANTEYLKNVILKFLALKPGDERSQLILVLTTMLRLSQDEIAFLSSYAKGDSSSKASGSSWSNYMHRWSGMS